MAELFSVVLPNIFIVCYLLFAIFWNAPEINLLHESVRSHAHEVIALLGLDHAWDMYSGPFGSFNRLQIRVTFRDNSSHMVSPWGRYEFRRYSFMIGNRSCPELCEIYLQAAHRLLSRSPQHLPKEVARIEVIRQSGKCPIRVGGVRGAFDPGTETCRETVVAAWDNCD